MAEWSIASDLKSDES